MRCIVYIQLFCLIASSPLFGQDDVATLKEYISELEAENLYLQDMVTMLEYTIKVRDGAEVNVLVDDVKKAQLIISPSGWETLVQQTLQLFVLHAETVFQAIPSEKSPQLTILVIQDNAGPMVLSQRGTKGEYLVLLDSSGRYWAQAAYQFSHELGHILCGDLSLEMPQLWFEEAFCEALSLWTLDRMGTSWETNAPFDSWKPYAPRFIDYSNDIRDRVSNELSLSDWYRQHRVHLSSESVDRDKNLILAKYFVKQAQNNPAFFRAFYYLRHNNSKTDDSLEKLLADWTISCPASLQFAPKTIAQTLGVSAPE